MNNENPKNQRYREQSLFPEMENDSQQSHTEGVDYPEKPVNVIDDNMAEGLPKDTHAPRASVPANGPQNKLRDLKSFKIPVHVVMSNMLRVAYQNATGRDYSQNLELYDEWLNNLLKQVFEQERAENGSLKTVQEVAERMRQESTNNT